MGGYSAPVPTYKCSVYSSNGLVCFFCVVFRLVTGRSVPNDEVDANYLPYARC